MAELDITQEQFLEACDKAQAKHAKIVQQIMAVENFVSFKKLMIKRNTELNEEALKMMLQKEKQRVEEKHRQEEEKKKKEEEDKKKEIEENLKKQALAKVHSNPPLGNIDPEFLRFEQEEFEAALKASMEVQEVQKQEEEEEEKLMQMVMQQSMQEEEERIKKVKQIEEEIVHKVEEESKKEAEKLVEKPVVEKPQIVEKPVEKIVEPQPVKKLEQVEEVKEEPALKKQITSNNKPSYSLPPVSMKKGGMSAFDADLLR